MDIAIEYALLLSPLLLVPVVIQRRWSRPLAIFVLASLIGSITAVLASMPLRGPGDAVVGRGLMVIYGMAVSLAMALIAGASLLWSAKGRAAAINDEENQRDSVEMFNRMTGGGETDR